MKRIVQKGNVISEDNYRIRIIEENGEKYHYHYLKAGEVVIVFVPSKPFKLKNMVEISLEDLPTKLVFEHEIRLKRNLPPNENQGKENTIRDIARCFDVYESHANMIYDTIGQLEKVEVISNKYPWIQYLVNEKWIIETKCSFLISIKEKAYAEEKKKNWGKRVYYIAKKAKTSFDMATVVGDIEDIQEAIRILKKIDKIVNSKDFYYEFKTYFSSYKTIYKSRFYSFLSHYLTNEQIKKLNFSEKFQNSLAIILKNK